jgi:hypothetical protein
MNDILNTLLPFIPEKYRSLVGALIVISPLVTRAIYALINRGGIKGIFSAIWLGTNTPKSSPPDATGGISKTGGVGVLVALGVASLLFITAGCHSPQLQAGGAYAPSIVTTNADGSTVTSPGTPETALFIADSSFKLAYDAIDGVFKFEMDNRADLAAKFPQLRPALDKLRPQVWKICKRWAIARQVYKANPTPAGLSQVQTILADIERLVPVAQAELSANVTATINQ